MAVIQLQRNDGVAAGLLGKTLVVYYERTPTMAAARTTDIAASEAIARLEQVAVLVVIGALCRTPDASARSATQETMQRFEAQMSALAYTIIGEGFSNAAARAAVSGMLLFTKPRYPAKVFASLGAAMDWLGSVSSVREEKRANLAQRIKEIEQFCFGISGAYSAVLEQQIQKLDHVLQRNRSEIGSK